jgi:L-asparaginase
MKLQPAIHILITGGTIDSSYDGTKDTISPREHSLIPKYIQSLKLYSQTSCTTICMKDSREISHQDRENLLETIVAAPEKHFIITHGTYTMADTARYLKKELGETDKRVVLTGSMVPLSITENSDGGFNLGFAVSTAITIDPGVYICMNGQIFLADEVTKAVDEGRFTSLFNK